jgi:hypothetical protein
MQAATLQRPAANVSSCIATASRQLDRHLFYQPQSKSVIMAGMIHLRVNRLFYARQHLQSIAIAAYQ